MTIHKFDNLCSIYHRKAIPFSFSDFSLAIVVNNLKFFLHRYPIYYRKKVCKEENGIFKYLIHKWVIEKPPIKLRNVPQFNRRWFSLCLKWLYLSEVVLKLGTTASINCLYSLEGYSSFFFIINDLVP